MIPGERFPIIFGCFSWSNLQIPALRPPGAAFCSMALQDTHCGISSGGSGWGWSLGAKMIALWEFNRTMENHHVLIENRHVLMENYHVLIENHHVLMENHHALIENHHVLMENHHALIENHHVLMENHHVLIENHHALIENHYALIEKHHVRMENNHVLMEKHPSLIGRSDQSNHLSMGHSQ